MEPFTLSTKGDADLAFTARRLVEQIFRRLEAHKWESLNDIFIDSKCFADYLQDIYLQTFHSLHKGYQDNAFYYEWHPGGRTWINEYNPMEPCLKISYQDHDTIKVEYING